MICFNKHIRASINPLTSITSMHSIAQTTQHYYTWDILSYNFHIFFIFPSMPIPPVMDCNYCYLLLNICNNLYDSNANIVHIIISHKAQGIETAFVVSPP